MDARGKNLIQKIMICTSLKLLGSIVRQFKRNFEFNLVKIVLSLNDFISTCCSLRVKIHGQDGNQTYTNLFIGRKK
jgi:hypothetical protein